MQKVTDPSILAQLNGSSPPAQSGPVYGPPPVPKAPDPDKDRAFNYDVTQDLVNNEQSLRKEFYSLPAVKEYQVAARTYANSLEAAEDASGDQSLIVAYAKMLDPNSVVREGEAAAVAGTDSTIGRSIATLSKEFGLESGGQLSPDIRAKIRREMRTLAENYGAAYNQERTQFSGLATSYGFDPDRIVGQDIIAPYKEKIDAYWAKQEGVAEQPPVGGLSFGDGSTEGYGDDGKGNPLVIRDNGQVQALVGYLDDAPQYGPPGQNAQIDPRAKALLDQIAGREGLSGQGGAADVAKQGGTWYLSDEAAGIGTVIGKAITGDFDVAGNYQLGREAEQFRVGEGREALGPAGSLAVEVAAGGGAVANVPGKVFGLAEGISTGGVAGFGSGEGFENSTSNALVGAGTGGAIVKGGQAVQNALAPRAANTVDAANVARAGQAEGVTVNRAMVDPSVANRVTKADASLIGGKQVQREMSTIEGQIEGRVSDLGRGGQAMDEIATGDKVKGAAERFIDKTGKSANAKYNKAEKLAGDTKVTPKQSLAVVDEAIATLKQTPETNSAEIKFLEGLKSDLSQDLSVGALRRMRTSLRKKISRGELVFGEDEARVLSVMDAAAEDIAAGLTAQGKEGAAKAFRAADIAYRARMEYINGTIQKIIGKRNANLSAEQVARKFNSMAGNDARGLKKFYATLSPDEAADVSATFAERLGQNNKGEFSVAHFLSQSEKMSDEALRTVFGPQGAESVKNLRVLGKEVSRVTSSMNSRTSKSGVANYRDWLWTAIAGGGGLFQGGMTAAAAATAVAAATAGKQIISARLLMSPRITKWITQAPKTTNPKAIDAHFAKLAAIAKAEPALANEIEQMRRGIMGAANDNMTASVAAEEPTN